MEIKKELGMAVGEFHRCDAPLVDDEGKMGLEAHTEATGACEQTTSDPNQWNQWAERISAGALNSNKPD